MSFNVSSLTAYVSENAKEMMTNIVAGANTFEGGFVRIEDGIKGGSSKRVHFYDPSLEYQLGACVNTTSGSTTFTEKTLAPTLFTSYDETCSEDMLSKWYSQFMKRGANQSNDDQIAQAIADAIVAKAKRDYAVVAWQGLRSTANDMATQVAGWLYKLINTSYSSSTFTTTATYTSITTSNAIAIVDDLIANAPANIIGGEMHLKLSRAYFNTLKVALRNANNFNFGAQDSPDSFVMPGYSNVTVFADDGLAAAKSIVLTVANNLILACDLMSDADDLTIDFVDNRKDKVFTRFKLAIGTEVAFPSNVGIVTML